LRPIQLTAKIDNLNLNLNKDCFGETPKPTPETGALPTGDAADTRHGKQALIRTGELCLEGSLLISIF
jgi:hypothetical protein